jgi:trehalose synthase
MGPASSVSSVDPPAKIREQTIARVDRERLRPLLRPEHYEAMEASLRRGHAMLAGSVLWHVNVHSIGGVTETVRALLGLMRDGGIDARWMLLEADGGFFELAQRLYEGLAGEARDFSDADRALYEDVLANVAAELGGLVSVGDVVLLYDPPTAGMAEALSERGAHVIWRCHMGTDAPDTRGGAAQEFLRPYIDPVDRYTFPRETFAWPGLDAKRTATISSSINPLSAKNEELEPEVVTAILDAIGLTDEATTATPAYARLDGSPSRVERRASIDQGSFLPSAAPMIAHVSSWDRLKDPVGVVQCFAGHCETDAHLVIAGPAPRGQIESPYAEAVRTEVREAVGSLATDVRDRVHVVSVPTEDLQENAVIVNALQRRADVFVRKSFSEGFGLSIAESMWKRTPVVASGIGGLQDLIVDGESGVLIADPNDLEAFGAAIDRIVSDPDRRARLGEAGRRRVAERFLISSHLTRYLELIESLRDAPGASR